MARTESIMGRKSTMARAVSTMARKEQKHVRRPYPRKSPETDENR